MARADFYVLSGSDDQQRFAFAARLCEKAYRQNYRVAFCTGSPQSAQALSDILWRLKPESFLPHEINDDRHAASPIVITRRWQQGPSFDLLINLTLDTPNEILSYPRVAEIVIQQPQILAASRQHWSFFKQNGFEVHNHPIT